MELNTGEHLWLGEQPPGLRRKGCLLKPSRTYMGLEKTLFTNLSSGGIL